jgi:modulator of FtsH protease HflC
MIRLLLVGIIFAGLFWLRTAAYVVDYAEFAYVTRFGEPVVTRDGAAEAGLHFKLPWPVDTVLRVDRRLHAADLPAVESLTRDVANNTVDKTLAVDAFVTWRVPDESAADRFVRTVGTPDLAHDNTTVARGERLRQRLLGEAGVEEPLREKVLAEYGIEIVDLRIRRFSYPEAVQAGIAERIRSERQRKVADYNSEGQKRAADILSAAEKEARTIEAEARAQKRVIEGQADAEADRIRNDAYAKDREFYVFLEKLKAYQLMLSDSRDVLLLSSKHPLLDLLLNPPKAP